LWSRLKPVGCGLLSPSSATQAANGFKISSTTAGIPEVVDTLELPLQIITTTPSTASSDASPVLLRPIYDYPTAPTTTTGAKIDIDDHQTREAERPRQTVSTEVRPTAAMSRLRRTEPADRPPPPGVLSNEAGEASAYG